MSSFRSFPSHLTLSSPLSKTLIPYKTLTILNHLHPPKLSHSNIACICTSPPEKLLSLSISPPIFASKPKIFGSFVIGAAFLSLIISALVSALRLDRKRRFSPLHRPIIRPIIPHYPESGVRIRNHGLYNWKMWGKESRSDLAVADLLKREKVASGRKSNFQVLSLATCSYDYASSVVPEQNFLRLANSRSRVQDRLSLRDEIPVCIRGRVGFGQFERLMFWEFYFLNGRGAESRGVILVKADPISLSDVEQQEEDDSTVKGFGGRWLFLLPSSTSVEILPSSITEQEEFPAQFELQTAIPALAMVAGIFGALAGGESGGLEIVGFVVVTSFVVYDLLWASRRRMLWEDIARVTDRETFVHFLLSRKIMVADISS